jgi:Leucine-rich repeat (LRR) protein
VAPGGTGLGDVLMKFREENPGYDGKNMHQNKAGEISSLTITSDKITELEALRGLPHLEALTCNGSAPGKGTLADLSPLKDMKLTSLSCSNTRVADLSPLQGMKLATLVIDHTRVTDVSPLRDMKLTELSLAGTSVSDLSPLKDMPLTHLNIADTKVTDLSDLRDLRLRSFNCGKTQVWDLSPLRDMPLTTFDSSGSKVTDFSILKDKPLKTIIADLNLLRDADSLRPIRTLDTINGKAARDFWKEVDAKQQTLEQWCKEVAAQPADKQTDMVADKLREQNPGFHGRVGFTIGNGVVEGVSLPADDVTDLSPLRALPGLRQVICMSTSDKGLLANLGPLKDLKLTDLSITGTRVTDLSPLRKLPLKELRCDGPALKDVESLRALKPTLEKINGKPASEFWKEVDEKQP